MNIYDLKLSLKFAAISFLMLVSSVQIQAQTSKQIFNISLENGKFMQIQVCSESIVRVRIQDKHEFQETYMERYGILKTDWKAVEAQSKIEDKLLSIQTSSCQFVVNQQTGEILVNDLKGNPIIKRVGFADGTSPISAELGQSLDKYFGKAKSGGGIIGDANYTGKLTEFDEVGNTKTSAILDISLKKEERFYGGGNTSRKNIQHRGTALRMWATYQKTEIPSPFLMSSNGWGIFNNTTAKNYFDVGRFQPDKLFIYNSDGNIDFYLMFGNSMADVINLQTTITGKPYLLPKWAYGLAFGGNTMQDEFDVLNDAVKFRDEKIPCDIFWIEPQWMAKYYDFSTSKKWNHNKFSGETSWNEPYYPKSEGKTLFIHKLHNLGFKLALWLCIDHDLTLSEEDHLAKMSGKPQSGQEHWFDHLTNFIDEGVDGFKLDPGRTLDEHPDRKYFNGQTDKTMHNLQQVLLPKQMYETFREHKGIRSFHHYCGGYAGAQHWSASTSGDNGGGKNALFDQLNLGLSGFVNTSADVLEGVDDNKAGLHLGFFLPWVQINSWYSMHQPWYMSPIEKETYRFYAQLRNALFPYIYSAALQGSQTGMPILRAMPLEFREDRNVDNMIYQYMFGENLLVNVFSDSIYLPKGNWINYWNGEKFEGGKTVQCKVPVNRGGLLFVKGGAIIPFQKPMQYIGEFPVDTLILKIYPDKKSSYTLLEDDGTTFDFEKGNIAKTR
ncbi:MAG: DUF4968 domain-containing protein, partial [Mariniphaga sp.]|nr:DUF4968 domain-containing protein [Mariniphaga sp.]